MKNTILYIAMFLMICCLPFRGNENEIRWVWADHTWVPLYFLVAALMCIAFYLHRKEAIKS